MKIDDPIVDIEVEGIWLPGRLVSWSWYSGGRSQQSNCGRVGCDPSLFGVGEHIIAVQAADANFRDQASDLRQIASTVEESPDLEACSNDDDWTTTRSYGQVECNWVGRNTRLRCAVRGDDGRRAFEACPRICGNDPDWIAEIAPRGGGFDRRKIDCRDVRQKPFNRCRAPSARMAFAFACCDYNKQCRSGTLGGSNTGIYDEVNVFDDEDFGGSIQRRSSRCCFGILPPLPK